MTEEGRTAEPDAATTRATVPSWRAWTLGWFAAMTVIVYVSLAVYLAIDSGRPQTLLLLVVWVPVIALVVAAMTLVAAALRRALARVARRGSSGALPAVIGLGALSGPLTLFVFFASGDPRMLGEPARAGLDVVFAAPVVLGGGVASWLAERQVSVRQPRWWVAVLTTALVGLLLLEPVRSLFPTYGTARG